MGKQMRIVYVAFTILCIPFILAGCQATSKVSSAVDTYRILQNKGEDQTALLSCSASVACYFARVDDVAILDEKTKKPTKAAIDHGLVRIKGSLFTSHHEYALSLVPDRHEIMVWFHPVSQDRAEQFHLIHTFKAGYQYTLSMYRQKSQGNGSLLQMATPGELCVDLLENELPSRRFCRTYNVLTGQGEFVEKQI